jgi:hypothetical protein
MSNHALIKRSLAAALTLSPLAVACLTLCERQAAAQHGNRWRCAT